MYCLNTRLNNSAETLTIAASPAMSSNGDIRKKILTFTNAKMTGETRIVKINKDVGKCAIPTRKLFLTVCFTLFSKWDCSGNIYSIPTPNITAGIKSMILSIEKSPPILL